MNHEIVQAGASVDLIEAASRFDLQLLPMKSQSSVNKNVQHRLLCDILCKYINEAYSKPQSMVEN